MSMERYIARSQNQEDWKGQIEIQFRKIYLTIGSNIFDYLDKYFGMLEGQI